MRRVWLAVLVSLAAACASQPKKPSAADLALKERALADARVLEGCYECLTQARAIYEKQAVGPMRRALVVPLFEVGLLIVLREKELAIDFASSLARARALVPELPPDIDAARYLAIVEAVPSDGSGVPQAEEEDSRRRQAPFIARISGEILWLQAGLLSPAVREYISLSIDCKYSIRDPGAARLRAATARTLPPDAPALLVYRLATCDEIKVDPLKEVRALVPDFGETSYFLARREVASAGLTGAPSARPLLAESFERFPQSSAVTYLNANFQQAIGNCREALAFYDRTIALRPRHENSLLGRTQCLVTLQRFDDAIATATQMIEWRLNNMNEAYYWRALVRHHQKDLPAARQDIETAKKIGQTRDIRRLAGVIEHDQEDLAVARTDLLAARNWPGGPDCVARWYLGLVDIKRSEWLESAGHFEDAMRCYETSRAVAEMSLKQLENRLNIDPEFKEHQIEYFKKAIQENRAQQYASAFNAAVQHARAGNMDKARALAGIAAADPALESKVQELRKIIGG